MDKTKTILLILIIVVIMLALQLSPGNTTNTPGTTTQKTSDPNHTWILIAGRNLTTYIADTPQERYCGYYCYDTPAIAFLWPEGAPTTVTFTMENINFTITLIQVRNCTVINVVVMEPDKLYTITDVKEDDFFVEVRGVIEVEPGDILEGPLCTIQGPPNTLRN